MFNEANTVEQMILDACQGLGWHFVPGPQLPRQAADVCEPTALAAGVCEPTALTADVCEPTALAADVCEPTALAAGVCEPTVLAAGVWGPTLTYNAKRPTLALASRPTLAHSAHGGEHE